MKFEISVVTGTRHRPESFMRFLTSLAKTATVPTELIVTDASDERTYTRDEQTSLSALMRQGGLQSVEVIHEKPRLGTLRGYNVAFRRAKGRYVVWFNDDAECLGDWQRLSIDFMDKHPEVGMGALYWKDVGSESWHVQTYWNMILANFGFIRREAGEQVGWFDERCGKMYACDNSIACAMIDANWAICQIPGTRVLHHRVHDQERRNNMVECVACPAEQSDGEKFVKVWGHRVPVLQQKYEKFRSLIGPIYVSGE